MRRMHKYSLYGAHILLFVRKHLYVCTFHINWV
jgi:hypothetical protein